MEAMTKKITTMKFKGTKHELVEILNGLYSTAELAGKEFAIASSKNISTIKEALKDIEEIAKPSQGFIDLAEKVKAIGKEEGSENLIQELEAENPELVQARKTQLEVVTEMLNEEMELTLVGITSDMLPEEIKSHQVSLLTKILID